MKHFIKAIIFSTFIFGVTNSLFSQEESVAFDSNKTIFKLNQSQEKQIGLFKKEGQFIDAELFKNNDSLFTIELHYKKDDKIFRDRQSISGVEYTKLREQVDSIAKIDVESLDDIDGRGLLLGTCLLSGLTTYGPALMGIVQSNNRQTITGLYMLGAGGLFFVPYFLTKDKPVSYGQANLAYYGLSRGFAHGFLFSYTFFDLNTVSSQFISTAGTITGIAEAALGYQLVKRLKISNGNSNLMTVYGDVGLLFGLETAIQVNDITKDNFSNTPLFAGLTLAGSVGGEVAGYFIGKKHQVSAGDAEIIQTTSILGSLLPLTVTSMFIRNISNPSTISTPSLLMGIAGLYVGHKLTQKVDYSFTQGFITKIGTVAGGLLGCGLTYLAVGDAEPWVYFTGTYIGAQASFLLLSSVKNPIFKSDAAKKIGFNIMPENFLMGQQLQKHNPEIRGMLPLARLSYSF